MDDLDPLVPTLRPVRKRRRGVALLPALFTLGNLLSGFAAINYASMGDRAFSPWFALAAYFVFLAMVFDMFDGFVARLTRTTSDFGAELDSLADMVSFGIAPAFLTVRLMQQLLGKVSPAGRDYLLSPPPFDESAGLRLFWIIAGIYVSCTAMRLARFNVITLPDALSHMYFRGMPSPGAAAIVSGSVVFFEWLGPDNKVTTINVTPQMQDFLIIVLPYLLPVMLLLSALLMVSRFSYVHLINRFLRGRKRFRTVVAFFLFVMAILWEPQICVLTGIYVYALSAPVMALYRALRHRKSPLAAVSATTMPPPPASPS